jgi:hypothetical protein
MLFNSTGVVKKLVDYLDRLCVEFLALWRRCLKLRVEDARKHEWIAPALHGVEGMLRTFRNGASQTDPKRQRGIDLKTTLTLRVSVDSTFPTARLNLGLADGPRTARFLL